MTDEAIKRVHHRIDDVEKEQGEMKIDIASHDIILRGDDNRPGMMEIQRAHSRFINKIERLVLVVVSAFLIEVVAVLFILITNK